MRLPSDKLAQCELERTTTRTVVHAEVVCPTAWAPGHSRPRIENEDASWAGSCSSAVSIDTVRQVETPWRLYSNPWRSTRPGDSSNTRSWRSSARMTVFSMQNTAAWRGGSR